MKTFVFRGRKDKCKLLADMLPTYFGGSVLDVGCGQKYLAPLVEGTYIGIDITGSPDIIVDAEYCLPFKDSSFDTVIALDVLEHLENIHHAFEELCRVARKYIIIGLPNMYEWHFRIMFLVGKKISEKYRLSIDPPQDRHRWIFSFDKARSFVRQRGALSGFEVCDELIGYYSYRRLLPKIITAIGKTFGQNVANLFSYYYCVVLKRKRESTV